MTHDRGFTNLRNDRTEAELAEARERQRLIDRIVWHCVALPIERVRWLCSEATPRLEPCEAHDTEPAPPPADTLKDAVEL